MQKLVFTNGGGQIIDLTSGNFGITNWEGLSGVGLNIQTQQVPFQDGGVYLDALMEQREISVTVAIQDNNDLSARYELKRQLISALNPKLGEGVLVYTNDYLSRQIKAVPQLPIFENKNSNDSGTLKASVTFSCCSPYWEDTEDTVVELELGENKNITNNGDIPVQMEIEFETSNVDNPSIIRQDGMQIGYKDKLDTNLIINTNFGEKKVEKEKIGFQIINPKLTSICFNQNKSIYVATGTNILICKDGENFEDLQIEATEVAYSPEKNIYVAIRYNGEWLTSTDGENWELHNNIGVSANLTYIYYINKKFYICTSSSSYILTSENGIDWTSSNPALAYPSCIAYAEDTGVYICTGYNHISYSTNGTTWTQNATTIDCYEVAYSSELGIFVISAGNGKFYITRDGTALEEVNSGISNIIDKITYSKCFKKFYASIDVEGSGSSKILSSQDGYNWEQTTFESNLQISCLVAIDLMNIVILSGTNFVTKTINGTTWNIPANNIGILTNTTYIKQLSLYVALLGTGGEKPYQIATSENGLDWEIRYSSATITISYRGITYSEELGKIVTSGTDDNNNYLITSEDGIEWQVTTINVYINKIVYSEDKQMFIATGSNCVQKSINGINWTSYLNGEDIRDVTYSETLGLFIEVGQYIKISNNGETWTKTLDAGSGEYFTKVIFAKGLFIAISSSRIVTSADGTNWTTITASVENILYSEYQKIFYGVKSRTLYKSENLYYWEKYQNIKGTNGLYFASHQKTLVVGEASLYCSEVSRLENAIDKLTQNSNMNLNIEMGLNTFRLNRIDGNFSARIKYRQKYIGV